MKTNLTMMLTLCCLTMMNTVLMNTAFGETPPTDSSSDTPPAPAIIRADDANSWATLGRLYVIVATTDNDETCGKTAKNNGKAIEQLFRKHIAQKAVTVLKIPPQNLSRQTLLSLFANLPIRGDDAVVFYYSGKGDVDRKFGQFFTLSDSKLPDAKEELYRSEIRSAILKQNPRLCVLVSDCCDPTTAVAGTDTEADDTVDNSTVDNSTVDNDTVDETEEKISEGKKSLTKESIADERAAETLPLFFSLFFTSRGSVDINSTTVGQASCANDNDLGCFTEVLTGLLEVNRNKILSWQRVFPYIREGTSLAFTRSYPKGADIGEGRVQKEQTPVLLHLGNGVIDSPTQLSFYPPNEEAATDAAVSSDEKRQEADRKMVIQLVQQAVGELRPFDAGDQGTHENYDVLDVDNTILGLNGKPFSKEILPVIVQTEGRETEENRSDNDDSGQAASAAPQKIRLGIQAADNQGDGVLISRVVAGFPGQLYGLEVGDVILEINNVKISSEKEYSDAVDAASGRLVIVTRSQKTGKAVTVTIGNL